MGKWMDDDAPGGPQGARSYAPYAGAQANDACRNCGQLGHYARNCAQNAGLNGGRGADRCNRCGQIGHWAGSEGRSAAAARGRAIGALGAEDSDTTRARARRRPWRRSREVREARRRRAITVDAWDTSRGTADKAAAREGTITPERRSNARVRVRTMCVIAAAKRDTGRARARNRTRERRPSARDKPSRTISATDAASSGTSPRIARCPRTTRAEFASKRDTSPESARTRTPRRQRTWMRTLITT